MMFCYRLNALPVYCLWLIFGKQNDHQMYIRYATIFEQCVCFTLRKILFGSLKSQLLLLTFHLTVLVFEIV